MEPGLREKPVESARGEMPPTPWRKETSGAERGDRWNPGGTAPSSVVERGTPGVRDFGAFKKQKATTHNGCTKIIKSFSLGISKIPFLFFFITTTCIIICGADPVSNPE